MSISLRGSGIWLVRACAASIVKTDGVLVNYGGKPADLGRAVHSLQAQRYRGEEPSIESTAQVFQVDDDELRMLDRLAQQAVKELMPYFPFPEPERYLTWHDTANDVKLSGHLDLSSLNIDQTIAFFLDYKSGRADSDTTDQGFAYAKLLFEEYPQVNRACGTFLMLRDGDRDVRYYTRDEANAWWAQVMEEVQYRDVYSPGSHCAYCPRGITCEAKNGLIRQAAETIAGLPLNEVLGGLNLPDDPELRAGIMVAILDRAKFLEDVCEKVRKAVKADVIAHGGSMITPDGRELKISTSEKKEIHYRRGAKLVMEAIGTGIHDCLRISKTKAIEKIRDAAPHRGKKKAEEAFLATLEDAGALITLSSDRLDVRRPKKQLAVSTEGETNGNSDSTENIGAANNGAESGV